MQAACWLLSPPSTPTLSLLLLVTDPPCGFPCATAVKPTVKEDLVKKVNNNLNITSAVFCNSETPSLYSFFSFRSHLRVNLFHHPTGKMVSKRPRLLLLPTKRQRNATVNMVKCLQVEGLWSTVFWQFVVLLPCYMCRRVRRNHTALPRKGRGNAFRANFASVYWAVLWPRYALPSPNPVYAVNPAICCYPKVDTSQHSLS